MTAWAPAGPLMLILAGFLAGQNPAFWAAGQAAAAVAGAPGVWAGVSTGLGLMLIVAFGLGRTKALPPAVGRAALFGLILVVGWLVRDRNHLLGDTSLWIRSIHLQGLRAHVSHEPLAVWALGLLTEGLGGLVSTPDLLAAVSLSGGVVVTAAVAVILRRGRSGGDSRGGVTSSPGLSLALVLAQPLSFVILGYPETYPILLAMLAIAFVRLDRDLEAGRITIGSLTLLLIAGFIHLIGLLAMLCLPVALVRSDRFAGRRWMVAAAGLVTMAVAVALWLIPATRPYALMAQPWRPAELAGYLADVINAWVVAVIPAGVLLMTLPSPGRSTRFERYLITLVLAFLGLPLAARFELGLYRDIDLLSPVVPALSVLLAVRLRRMPMLERPVWLAAASGALLLAGWLTGNASPVGAEQFRVLLDRPGVTESRRSYGSEILAAWYRDHGQSERALLVLGRACERTPDNSRLWGLLGQYQLEAGDTTAAVSNLRRGLESNRWPEAAAMLAGVLLRRGDVAGSLELFEGRRDLAVRQSSTAAALATAWFQAGRPDSTIAVARDRLKLGPDDAVAWFNLSAGLAALGRYDDALAAIDRAVQLSPERVEWQWQRARLRDRTNR